MVHWGLSFYVLTALKFLVVMVSIFVFASPLVMEEVKYYPSEYSKVPSHYHFFEAC